LAGAQQEDQQDSSQEQATGPVKEGVLVHGEKQVYSLSLF
jgi:hypothetical protein